jgi:hypothetical protein
MARAVVGRIPKRNGVQPRSKPFTELNGAEVGFNRYL